VGSDDPSLNSIKKLKNEIKPRFKGDFDEYFQNYFDKSLLSKVGTRELNSFIKSLIKNKLIVKKSYDINSNIKLTILNKYSNSPEITVNTSSIRPYIEKGPSYTMRLNTCDLKLKVQNANNFGKKIDEILRDYYNYEDSNSVPISFLSDASNTYNNIEIELDNIGIDIYFKLNVGSSCNTLVGGSKDDWTDVLDVDGLLGQIKLKDNTINIEDLGSYIEKYLVNKKEPVRALVIIV